MVLSQIIKSRLQPKMDSIGRFLGNRGISPNVLIALGFTSDLRAICSPIVRTWLPDGVTLVRIVTVSKDVIVAQNIIDAIRMLNQTAHGSRRNLIMTYADTATCWPYKLPSI